MPCYVDSPIWQLGRMKMCHLIADTPGELHEMAKRLKLDRAWFQLGKTFPHYDISKSKRTIAIGMGAIECTRREFVEVMKRFRQTHPNWRDLR